MNYNNDDIFFLKLLENNTCHVCPAGGPLRGPHGVLHRAVHPQRLREGEVGPPGVSIKLITKDYFFWFWNYFLWFSLCCILLASIQRGVTDNISDFRVLMSGEQENQYLCSLKRWIQYLYKSQRYSPLCPAQRGVSLFAITLMFLFSIEIS